MEFGEIKIFNGKVIIDPAGGTVWLTKHQIADLFGVFISKVGSNINAILKTEVLDESKVCQTLRYSDGSSVILYNLEMITALAFRIKSKNADLLRQLLMKRVVEKHPDRKPPIFLSWNDKSLLN